MRAIMLNMGFIFGFVAVVVAGAMIDNRVRPELMAYAVPSYAELVEQKRASTVFGEFRTSARDMLWARSEVYLHGGVAYRPKDEQPIEESVHHDTAHHHDESECPTLRDNVGVVPDKGNDWRGFLGDWERQIAPYFVPGHHKHMEARETLPLFRLMVVSDPHFARAYVIGANIICDSPGRVGEALAFLEEGLEQNPDSIEIHTEIARYQLYYHRDYVLASNHLKQAIHLARRAPKLSEDEDDAFRQAYHWLVICYAQEGKSAERLATAKEGLSYFPDDPVLLRALNLN